jgi:Cu2+-containing amine oxidase
MWKLMSLIAALGVISAYGAEPTRAEMTPERLQEVISEIAGPVETQANVLVFSLAEREFYCIFDTAADRMRIVSPIAQVADLSPEQIITALAANYHTALDARYAMADGIMYSAYIHPLSPLTDDELRSAIEQVARANLTFGTSYSSTDLSFGLPQAEPDGKGGAAAGGADDQDTGT